MPKVNKPKEDTKKAEAVIEKKLKSVAFYQAVGRRKVATARVRLYLVANGEVTVKGKVLKGGDIVVNGKPAEQYFPGLVQKGAYLEPFKTTETLGRYAVSAIVAGGGPAGQLGAFVHGAARALEQADKDKFHLPLKQKNFLTRDSRAKERRKAGYAHKARSRRQSPKR